MNYYEMIWNVRGVGEGGDYYSVLCVSVFMPVKLELHQRVLSGFICLILFEAV